MTLANLLSESQIVPEMVSEERWDAISELVDCLIKAGRFDLEDRDGILDAIRQREQTMSTGIGFGIAIPHASSDKVDEVVAAFGRSVKGVQFESLDGQPVFFIVLFVVPKDQFQTHLRTLAAIAKFLNDKTVRDELGSASNAAAILQVFENRSPRS
jgi:mannitol/fructose-specific phosphotransferase system IIA component (Ntr-type)